ncbi:MAG: agmatinase [Candidatus Ranarchaeia archaeon]
MKNPLEKKNKRSMEFLGLVEEGISKKSATGGILGIPYDQNSSYRTGARFAPKSIRESSNSEMMNSFTENSIDITQYNSFFDFGDLDIITDSPSNADLRIRESVKELVNNYNFSFFLGGDHSITPPIIAEMSRKYPKLGLMYFDAHLDLYDGYNGSGFSHACSMRRIIEEKLIDPSKIIIIGARSMPDNHLEYAKTKGVKIIPITEFMNRDLKSIINEINDHFKTIPEDYISVDMDVFDPGFAPGVSNPEPGGMVPRELIWLLHNFPKKVIGFDISELNPTYDVHRLTSILAAKLVKELVGLKKE